MAVSKKDGGNPKRIDRSGQILLSVVSVLAVLSVLFAAVGCAFRTSREADPISFPDLDFTRLSVSESAYPDPELSTAHSTAADRVTSTPQGTTAPLPSTNTTESAKSTVPAESEKPTNAATVGESEKSPETTGSKNPTEPVKSTEQKETTDPTSPEKTGGEPSLPDDAIRALLDSLSPEEKVYQLFIVTPEQLCGSKGTLTQAGDDLRAALSRYPVGGVIFFAGNIRTPDQVTRMIAGMQEASRLGLFIAVDEEGGTVARLGKNSEMGTTAFPPMGEIGATGDTERAWYVGFTIGQDLKRFGFNLDFAPVADVNSNPANPVIKNRAFSDDPRIAAEMVAACVAGFRESGVLCTLKHFPGHGDTATDSHYGSASSSKTPEELWACEFLPFQSGIAAGADVVMLGHIALPNVTGNDLPATLSYEITTGILREQLGFEGLIVTDSMSMAAITNRFSSKEAAVRAILAGADLILMPSKLDDAVNGVLDALKRGEISEERLNESVYRILSAKYERGILSSSHLG